MGTIEVLPLLKIFSYHFSQFIKLYTFLYILDQPNYIVSKFKSSRPIAQCSSRCHLMIIMSSKYAWYQLHFFSLSQNVAGILDPGNPCETQLDFSLAGPWEMIFFFSFSSPDMRTNKKLFLSERPRLKGRISRLILKNEILSQILNRNQYIILIKKNPETEIHSAL